MMIEATLRLPYVRFSSLRWEWLTQARPAYSTSPCAPRRAAREIVSVHYPPSDPAQARQRLRRLVALAEAHLPASLLDALALAMCAVLKGYAACADEADAVRREIRSATTTPAAGSD